MATTRSARGAVVNFELIAIKQQLASRPIPVSVDERRRFIDEKDGIRTKQVVEQEPVPAIEQVDALALAIEGAEESAAAAKATTTKKK